LFLISALLGDGNPTAIRGTIYLTPHVRFSGNRTVIYPLQHNVTMIYYDKSGRITDNRSCRHILLSWCRL